MLDPEPSRYATHGTCTDAHRGRIYELKNALVTVLVERGYLMGHGRRVVIKPPRTLECWSCYGGGCERCEFTGTHRELRERRLVFVVLRFEFDGKTYTWHQPEEDFSVPYRTASRGWSLATGSLPNAANRSRSSPRSSPRRRR